MNTTGNKFIAVSYKLYTIEDGERELVEETTAGRPFQFLSGFGLTLEAFENQIVGLEKGAEFDFELTKEEAYGDYEDERVLELDKQIFTINGHFDRERIYPEAIIPLQNEEGNRFMAKVVSITEDKVTVDLNHPLAGCTLNFKGTVDESRQATEDEIKAMISRLSGEGCGCGCHDCGGDCGGGGCDDGCGGHHDHECGCGHCH